MIRMNMVAPGVLAAALALGMLFGNGLTSDAAASNRALHAKLQAMIVEGEPVFRLALRALDDVERHSAGSGKRLAGNLKAAALQVQRELDKLKGFGEIEDDDLDRLRRAVGDFDIELKQLPGDFSGDGLVDAADFVIWRNGFAEGKMTMDDYNRWRDNYGETLDK